MIRCAIVGATGLVGRTALDVLNEFDLPINEYVFFASKKSAGSKINFKDTEYIVNFVIQMLFYGTPILYNLEMFSGAPKFLLTLVQLNPMTQFIQFYRDIFYYQQSPSLFNMGCIAVLSIVVVVIGYKIFKKLEKSFVEEL